MCFLTKKLNKELVEGYKVVAEKDGKNYSLAMGICYEDYSDGMPILKKGCQYQISRHYNNRILENKNFGFSEEMQGRTAIFLDERNAFYEAYQHILIFPSYLVKVKRARVSVDLMEGTIAEFSTTEVVAGRKIELFEEIIR